MPGSSGPSNGRRVMMAAAVSCAARHVVVSVTVHDARQATAAGGAGDAHHRTTPKGTVQAETVKVSSSPFVNGPGAVTLAGTGSTGFSGDGGAASSAELDAPGGIADRRP